ncbi:MAG TPA: MFS transporter [Woeseiaceae bacterium]|nr:MFS transporter [Woeseiaceae bacterium]
MKTAARAAVLAWLIAAVYYFYQYMLRSAPAVMLPELSTAFGISAAGVASLAGLFYFGYSPFSLVAGVAMDRFGPRRVIPFGAALVGVGALMFASGGHGLASIGRFLQGAGGVFALIGAVYIATHSFPPSKAATLIGATQMFGMGGGSAGQFAVGPMIAAGVAWSTFWVGMGIAGLVIAVLLLLLIPKRPAGAAAAQGPGVIAGLVTVFRNPQSLLCGAIAGLMFIPTTIFDMVWGVRFLQEGIGYDYGEAVMRSATVPLGWMIGCPLLGAISDKLGRRKPVMLAGGVVLLGCLAWILYGPADILPPYLLGTVTGIASGAAMLPYTVIKEANPAELGGTATGVVNFLNFTFSALLGPVFAAKLVDASGGIAQMRLEHYQVAFEPLLYGVGLALVLILVLRETGPARAPTNPELARSSQ